MHFKDIPSWQIGAAIGLLVGLSIFLYPFSATFDRLYMFISIITLPFSTLFALLIGFTCGIISLITEFSCDAMTKFAFQAGKVLGTTLYGAVIGWIISRK